MRRPAYRSPLEILAVVLLAILATGCVSKKELEKAQAAIVTCDEDKAVLEAKVAQWEDRFDRESTRWESVGAEVTEAVPRALGEMHAERKRILEMVPEQVQTEVETYLEDYFTTVMQGFEALSRDNASIQLELQATQRVLENLGEQTRNIGSSTQAINDAIDQALADEQAKVAEVSLRLSDVVEMISEFDQTRVNCKGCPDRLRLNKKEREAILGLHGELMAALSQLQSTAN